VVARRLISAGTLVWLTLLVAPPAAAEPVHHAVRLHRDDPRPAGDLPAGIVPEWQQQPQSTGRRRTSRRARRRAQRRGWEEAPPPASINGIDVVLPVAAHSRLRIDHRDIPYGTGSPHHRFNIFLPGGCRQGQLPLVIWLPGADWSTIDRNDCPILWLTSHGYAVASVGYRPSSVGHFPAQRDDCRAAFRQLAEDAALWGIAPDRIAVVGQAGGGHLAALLGLDGQPVGAAAPTASEPAVPIAAICSLSPITHLPTLGPDHDRASSAASRLIGGPLPELREAALAASPLGYASPGDPPTLLIHERTARLVPVSQSERLHRALQTAGVDSQLIIHDEMKPGITADSRVGRLLLAFLDRTLTAGTVSIVVHDAAGQQDGG